MSTKELEEKLKELEDKFDTFKKDKEKEIDKLKADIKLLTERRVNQVQILNEAVKMRHIGEGVRYIRSGLAADRPTSGEEPLQGSACYFATDTNVLSVWNGSAWVSETLS